MLSQTKYDVASAALVMVGAQPVTTFSDGDSAESISCFHLYRPTVDNLLEMHPWRFATRVLQLSRLYDNPDTGFNAAYNAPAQARRIQRVYANNYSMDLIFNRYEDEIHVTANTADKVFAEYSYYPPESQWPGYFSRLVTLDLASQFAVTLAGKMDLSAQLQGLFDRQFRMAKSTDSQQQTTKKLRVDGRNSIREFRQT